MSTSDGRPGGEILGTAARDIAAGEEITIAFDMLTAIEEDADVTPLVLPRPVTYVCEAASRGGPVRLFPASVTDCPHCGRPLADHRSA